MKYSVTVNGVGLEDANRIIKAVSEMGFGVPVIAECAAVQNETGVCSLGGIRRERRGTEVYLKNNGMAFISLLAATNWLRESCHVRCSASGLKDAIIENREYHGFRFGFLKVPHPAAPEA